MIGYKAIPVFLFPPILLVSRQHLTHLCGRSWLLPKPIRLFGVSQHPADSGDANNKTDICFCHFTATRQLIFFCTFLTSASSEQNQQVAHMKRFKSDMTNLPLAAVQCESLPRPEGSSRLSQQARRHCGRHERSFGHMHVAQDQMCLHEELKSHFL